MKGRRGERKIGEDERREERSKRTRERGARG